jgi:heptosyltransferase-1
MGDILHAMPAVAALRQRLTPCFLGWAIEPHWSPLLAASHPGELLPETPLVDRIHAVPTREWKQRPVSVATLRQIAELRRGMHRERYDLCIDLQGAIRSACIGRLAGAGRLFGPARPRERQARALYGERVNTHAAHVIDQACELISAAFAASPPLAPAPVLLPRDPTAEAWCKQLFAGDLSRKTTVLLAPTAGWGAKQWPSNHFAELAKALRHAGCRVLINAAAPDEPIAAEIAVRSGAEVLACTLPQLIALCRRVDLVLGGDTGPVHLAAALGRRVVALFGPTDPARNGPYFPVSEGNTRVRVLRHPASVLDHRRHAETEAGLARITVEAVAAEAFSILAEAPPPDPEAPYV